MFPSHRFLFCESSQRCFSGAALAPRGLSRNRALVNLDIILGSFSRSAGAFPSISPLHAHKRRELQIVVPWIHDSGSAARPAAQRYAELLCSLFFTSLHCFNKGPWGTQPYRALSLPWDLMKFMLRYLDRKATSCSLVLRRDDSCESSDQTPSDREVWVTETNTPGPMLRTLLWLMCLDLSINSFSLFMSRRRAVRQQQGL